MYASNTLANMESPTYTGPDGTSGTYYSTPTGESFHSSVVGRYFRCQAFLSSDSGQTTTPDFSGLRVSYAGGSGANAWSETVNTFDSRGNMTRREKTYWNGSATVTDTDVRDDASWSAGDRINNLNQVKKRIVTPAGGSATTWTFSYDANGRMTSKSDGTNTTTYVWDADEPRLLEVKLNGVTQVTYAYDSAGRMLVRTPYSGGVAQTPSKFEWDGWTMVKETTGSVVTRYIAPQGQMHSFERGGQVYQVHSDGHNGSVRAITDASGAVVAHYEFDAWGAQLGSSSAFSGGFSYGYVGGLGVRTDEATGLIWMRHRWYDPSGLQRFLSRDVLGSLNRYEYCYSNPVNWVDLDGLKPEGGGNHMKTGSDGVNLYYNDASLTGLPNGIPRDWQKRKEPDGTNFYSNYFVRKKLPKYDLPEIKLPKFTLDFTEVECPERPLALPDLPRWEFPKNRDGRPKLRPGHHKWVEGDSLGVPVSDTTYTQRYHDFMQQEDNRAIFGIGIIVAGAGIAQGNRPMALGGLAVAGGIYAVGAISALLEPYFVR